MFNPKTSNILDRSTLQQVPDYLMSYLLDGSTELQELRPEDFERTQLLSLSLEQEALSYLPHLSWFTPMEKQAPIVWHSGRNLFQITWLCVYPFFLWFRNFSRVLLYTCATHPRKLLHLRLDLVKWIFLVILAPIVALVSIFWNICYYTFPQLVFKTMEAGAYFVVCKEMLNNVDHHQSLIEMSIEGQAAEGAFSQAIAEFLCLISAVTYTRWSRGYAQAERLYRDLVAIDGQVLPREPVLSRYPAQRRQILSILRDSEEVMRQYAQAVGLDVAVISELDSGFGGPTASMFVSKQANVIIVAIRGTNPFDAREILVDAAFEKVAALPKYFKFLDKKTHAGALHQGFYASLFALRSAPTYPAQRIRQAIIAQAKQMHNRGHVQLFITGHSLGAATASILAASLSDLEPEVHLRSAYLYGTPMHGDSAFCCAYDKNPTTRIWRVINDGDFVTKIPPSINLLESDGGIGNMINADKMLDGSILDYSALGCGIKYNLSSTRPAGIDGVTIVCNVKPELTPETVWWIALFKRTPLKKLIEHSTRSYSVTLKRSRAAMLESALIQVGSPQPPAY